MSSNKHVSRYSCKYSCEYSYMHSISMGEKRFKISSKNGRRKPKITQLKKLSKFSQNLVEKNQKTLFNLPV